MSNETVLLQYLGLQQPWKDNIRNSGRVWPTPKSVLEVPAAEKWSYLVYPTLFKVVTPRELEIIQAANADEVIAPILAELTKLPDSALEKIAEFIVDEVERRDHIASQPQDVATAPSGTEGQMTLGDIVGTNDTGTMQAFAERIRRVSDALKQMDLKFDLHARNGMPIAASVQEFCGFLPSNDEILEAMKVLGLELPVTATVPMAPPSGTNPNVAPAAPTPDERADRILTAVASLNRESPEDWAKTTNTPRVDRIKALTGLTDVTAAEIAAALTST